MIVTFSITRSSLKMQIAVYLLSAMQMPNIKSNLRANFRKPFQSGFMGIFFISCIKIWKNNKNRSKNIYKRNNFGVE